MTPSLVSAAEAGHAHAADDSLVHLDIALTSTAVALAGIVIAAVLYLGSPSRVEWLTRRVKPLYQLSYRKLFFDQIYRVLFVWPLWLLARFSYWVDRWLIDGLVNLCGRIPRAFGAILRSMQTGMVQFYALAMLLGVLVLIGTLIMWPGD